MFKSTLVHVENPYQHQVLTAFSKGLLADPTIINNPTYNNLSFSGYKRSQDDKTLITYYIKMEKLWKNSIGAPCCKQSTRGPIEGHTPMTRARERPDMITPTCFDTKSEIPKVCKLKLCIIIMIA